MLIQIKILYIQYYLFSTVWIYPAKLYSLPSISRVRGHLKYLWPGRRRDGRADHRPKRRAGGGGTGGQPLSSRRCCPHRAQSVFRRSPRRAQPRRPCSGRETGRGIDPPPFARQGRLSARAGGGPLGVCHHAHRGRGIGDGAASGRPCAPVGRRIRPRDGV